MLQEVHVQVQEEGLKSVLYTHSLTLSSKKYGLSFEDHWPQQKKLKKNLGIKRLDIEAVLILLRFLQSVPCHL